MMVVSPNCPSLKLPLKLSLISTTSSVEQPALAAKPYITLLQLEGERKRLIDEIVDFVANKFEDPEQAQSLLLPKGIKKTFH